VTPHRHSHREILALNVACADVLRIGIAEYSYEFRGVVPCFNFSRERINERISVSLVAVARELHSGRETAFQIADTGSRMGLTCHVKSMVSPPTQAAARCGSSRLPGWPPSRLETSASVLPDKCFRKKARSQRALMSLDRNKSCFFAREMFILLNRF
jgi:hypothetical protein